MIELRQLRYAVIAADEHSFSRAAISLNMKQSTLSRKVLRLEDQLGFRLFDRTTRGAHPTKRAAPFLDAARQIIQDMDDLQIQAIALRKRGQGCLALGYSGALLAGPLIAALSLLLKQYPDTHFDGYEHSPQRLLEALTAGVVDAVVAPRGFSQQELEYLPLWSEPLRVCFASTHRLVGSGPISWQDLGHEAFVLPAFGLGPVFRQILIEHSGAWQAKPDISLQAIGVDGILSLVAMTQKVTLMVQPVSTLAFPTVRSRQILDAEELAHVDFGLHWQNTNTNPLLAIFRKIAENCVRHQE